jgi:hypothetical protein
VLAGAIESFLGWVLFRVQGQTTLAKLLVAQVTSGCMRPAQTCAAVVAQCLGSHPASCAERISRVSVPHSSTIEIVHGTRPTIARLKGQLPVFVKEICQIAASAALTAAEESSSAWRIR